MVHTTAECHTPNIQACQVCPHLPTKSKTELLSSQLREVTTLARCHSSIKEHANRHQACLQ